MMHRSDCSVYLKNIVRLATAGLLSSASCLVFALSSNAQIIPDTSLGTENSIVVEDVLVRGSLADLIEGGAIRNLNLFHSFVEFNVDEGQQVYFSNPEAITNIFSRITGTDPSDILGTLGVDGSANLFLVNPNGIIFGENASLDVASSFVATTADAIQFGDRGIFSTSLQKIPGSLLTVNPSALLFDHVNTGVIQNFSRAPAGSLPSTTIDLFGLRVPNGESLLLVGGEIVINGGGLVALGGRLELISVSGGGTVPLSSQRDQPRTNLLTDISRDNVTLTNNAGLIVSSDSDGDIIFFVHDLNVLNQSTVEAGIGPNIGNLRSQAGNVIVNATGTVTIRQASTIQNLVNSDGIGRSGNLNLRANQLIIQSDPDNARSSTRLLVGVNTNARGRSGNLNIRADQIQVSGSSARLLTLTSGNGDSGDLTINARHIQVDSGGQISSSTFGEGNSGKLFIRAEDSIQLEGSENNIPSGLFAQVNPNSEGDGGLLSIFAGTLVISDEAEISASTFSTGNAGNLDIQITEELSINNGSISTLVTQDAIGQGGDITIRAQEVILNSRSRISSESLGQGRAGDIRLNRLSNLYLQNSAVATSAQITAGGLIEINSDEILSFGSSEITTNVAIGSGNSGQIQINADSIELRDDSDIQSNIVDGIGNGGTITIVADSIIAFDDSDIIAAAPQGRGGDINIVTPIFFGESFSTNAFDADPNNLDRNNQTDINATGIISSGTIRLPDTRFIQNSLSNLSENVIDTELLIANSCVANIDDGSTFLITGLGGLPYRPGDYLISDFPTGAINDVGDELPNTYLQRPWEIGDPIREPERLYQLPGGHLIMSHSCT